MCAEQALVEYFAYQVVVRNEQTKSFLSKSALFIFQYLFYFTLAFKIIHTILARKFETITAARPNKQHIKYQNTDNDEPAICMARQDTHTFEVMNRLRLAAELLLLAAIISFPLLAHAGWFERFFSSSADMAAAAVITSPTVVDMPLLTALTNPNPKASRGGADIVVNENTLVSTGPVGADVIAEQKDGMGEIRLYTVREGDSLSEIADMFSIKTNTILWANDLKRATDIRSGDTLVILPITGVRHVVKRGDTIGVIAKKYDSDAEEILSYNQLASADDLMVGETLIIPGGAMHSAVKSVAKSSTAAAPTASSAGFSHPAPGSVRTQGVHGYNAVDLASYQGSPIRAAAAGTVIVSKSSGWNGGYGRYMVIKHANGSQTLYAHLMRNDVGVGAYVAQGQVIGGMGSTGRSTGTHLHFEVRGARNPF